MKIMILMQSVRACFGSGLGGLKKKILFSSTKDAGRIQNLKTDLDEHLMKDATETTRELSEKLKASQSIRLDDALQEKSVFWTSNSINDFVA